MQSSFTKTVHSVKIILLFSKKTVHRQIFKLYCNKHNNSNRSEQNEIENYPHYTGNRFIL